MNKEKLIHGQALAMQWVGMALQKLIAIFKSYPLIQGEDEIYQEVLEIKEYKNGKAAETNC